MDISLVLAEPLTAAELRLRLIERQRLRWHGQGPQARAALLRRLAPQAADRILAQAEAFQLGQMVLPGTEGKALAVGTPPRWHANFAADSEVICTLNRMYHWPVLLRAHALSGERRFAAQVVTELMDWITCCPRPPVDTESKAAYRDFAQPTPWRSLEAGIRLFDTWPWICAHLADDELLTPEVVACLAVSLYEHAEVMAEICPVFWPRADHNHYLMENLGLLSATAMMPELAGAARWRTRALRELERCAAAQLTEDGGQIEGCPGYHNGCISWFCHALCLGRAAGENFSADYRARVRRGLDYSVHSERPTGVGVPWGDSDATDTATTAAIWWREASGDAAPLQTLLPIAGRERTRAVALELLWVVDDPEALLDEVTTPVVATPPPRVHWQRELSQVALRTAWTRDALSVFFACRSPANNGHAHLDTAGFDFCALGRNLIADPGRYTYHECPERYQFKSAAWHSTVTVDGRDPFAYHSTWDFGEQREGRVLHVWERPGLLAADSMQRNFAPATHRRLVAILDGRALLVIDSFDKLAPVSAVQRWFHIDSTNVRWDARAQQAEAVCGNVALRLMSVSLDGSAQGSCLPGRISETYDSWRESTRLCLDDPGPGAASRAYATLLLPYHCGNLPPTVSDLEFVPTGAGLQLTFKLDDRARVLAWTTCDVSYSV